MKNEFIIEFTDDGRMKVQTGEFDMATHRNADQLMDLLLELGTEEERIKLKQHKHTHTHQHIIKQHN